MEVSFWGAEMTTDPTQRFRISLVDRLIFGAECVEQGEDVVRLPALPGQNLGGQLRLGGEGRPPRLKARPRTAGR
jgi:hypothetical protein